MWRCESYLHGALCQSGCTSIELARITYQGFRTPQGMDTGTGTDTGMGKDKGMGMGTGSVTGMDTGTGTDRGIRSMNQSKLTQKLRLMR